MNKIITIFGARPQFIKSALVSKELRKIKGVREILIHTGQHFDFNMSEIFFKELGLKKPKYYLEINNLSHGAMTGKMLQEIETILIKEKPNLVLVYGDTNSTLAGALAAAKLNVPVAHIESGLRSNNYQMPEEINRVLTDKISKFLFCPTDTAVNNLISEGLDKNGIKIIKSGDVMYDSIKHFSKISSKKSDIIKRLKLKKFALCTIHRPENTDFANNLRSIFNSFETLANKIEIVIPIHPRTRKRLKKSNIQIKNITVIESVGYFDMLELLKSTKIVLTDSGGLQKEAFFFQKPCVTLREETEWVELVENGFNYLAGNKKDKILRGYEIMINKKISKANFYGDGHSAKKIVNELIL